MLGSCVRVRTAPKPQHFKNSNKTNVQNPKTNPSSHSACLWQRVSSCPSGCLAVVATHKLAVRQLRLCAQERKVALGLFLLFGVPSKQPPRERKASRVNRGPHEPGC